VLRPDHVPTLFGESNDKPGYAVLGRLFAIGYIRGLGDALERYAPA
jgi:mannonate dehydratase